MSDSPQAEDSDSDADADADADAGAGERPETPSATRRSRRRRRAGGCLLLLVLALGGGWLALPTLSPTIFDALLAEVDMACTIQEVELTLGGEITVRGVEVWFRSDGEPLLSAAELRGQIELAALWEGRLRIQRVEARDLRATVVRDPDGRLALVRKILAALPADILEDHDPSGLEVRLDLVEVSGLHLRWEDRSVDPPAHLELQGEFVSGRHLVPRRDGTPALIEGRVTLGQAGIAFVTSYQSSRWDGLRVQLEAGELPLLEAEPYLGPTGIRLADDAGLTARGRVTVEQALRGGIRLGLDLTEVALTQGDRSSVELRSLVLEAERIDPEVQVYDLRVLRADVGDLELRPAADGTLALGALILPAPQQGDARPDVFLGELSLQAQRVRVAAVSPGAPSLEWTDLRVENRDQGRLRPILLKASRLEESLPLHLRLSGGVAPVCSWLVLDVHATDLARRPELDIDLRCEGLDSDGLEAYLPGLGFSAWDGQTLSADVQATFDRPLRELDFGASLSGHVLVEDLRLGPSDPSAEAWVTWEELEASIGRLELDPYHLGIERLEVVDLVSAVHRVDDGWRIAGVHVGWVSDAPPQAAPSVEIQQLSIDVERLRLEDRTVQPISRVRLVESAISGSLRLGSPQAARLLLRLEGFGDPTRDDFDQLTGVLDFLPGGGRGELSLSDFDLLRVRGLLRELGVDVEEGRLDLDLTLRRRSTGRLHLVGLAVLRDLQLADAGALRSFLGVSIPLDAVLFLLRDHRGEFQVPLDLEIDSEGEVAGERVGVVVAKVIGRALGRSLLTSPLRSLTLLEKVGRGLVRLIPGLGREEPAELSSSLSFLPADRDLSEPARRRVAALGKQLAEREKMIVTLGHRLGDGDVARIESRVSPPPGVLRDLVKRLRWQLGVIEGRRREQVIRLEAALTQGSNTAERIARQIRRLELAEGHVHVNLDQVLRLLRDDAGRRAKQRLRRACQELAAARLEAVVRELAAAAPDAKGRVRVLRPRYKQGREPAGGRIEMAVTSR